MIDRGLLNPGTRKYFTPSRTSERGNCGTARETIKTSWPRRTNSLAVASPTFSIAPPMIGGTGRKAPCTMVIFMPRRDFRLESPKANQQRAQFRTGGKNKFAHLLAFPHVFPAEFASRVR